MTQDELSALKALAEDLISPNHRQPIEPNAVYRTRSTTLFQDASRAITSLLSEREALRKGLEDAYWLFSRLDHPHPSDHTSPDYARMHAIFRRARSALSPPTAPEGEDEQK